MSTIGDIGKTIGGPVAGAIFGLFRNKDAEDQRQIDQQQKLTDMGVDAGQKMAKYNSDLQYDMWNKTNAEAQMKHLKEAGLNPALIYGGSGAGGATTGSASGNVASTGSAANSAQTQQANTASVGMGLQLASQLALQKAQKENIEADTENKKATAGKTGVETALGEIEKEVKGSTKEAQIQTINETASKALADAVQAQQKQVITEETMKDQIKTIQQEAINKILQNEQTSIENRKKEAEVAVKQFEARMAEQGISTNTPWYVKMVAELLNKIGINPLK